MGKDQGSETYGLLRFDPLREWDPEHASEKLMELYTNVLALVDDKIEWYHRCRSKKGKSAKRIRGWSIALLVTSTLLPYAAAIFKSEAAWFLAIGYTLAGIGGGLLLMDRYSGTSNSWLRFILTGMDLENMRNAFMENWQILYLNSMPMTLEGFSALVGSLTSFQQNFYGVVKAETQTWAREFEENFKELIKALKAQSDELKDKFEKAKKEATERKSNTPKVDVNVPSSIVREAIDRKFGEWKTVFNLVAVNSGKKMINGKRTDINCIIFSPSSKLKPGKNLYTPIPASIHYDATDGRVYDIPTDVRESGGPILTAAALLCDNTKPKRPGCSISRKNSDNAGTFGLIVYKDKNSYLLSCYHVLCDPELKGGSMSFSAIDAIGSTQIISPGKVDSTGASPDTIATIVDGELDGVKGYDCAIALIDDPISVTDTICGFDVVPGDPVDITEDDATGSYRLASTGRTTGEMNGVIEYAYSHCDIEYEINGQTKTITMNGLIATSLPCAGGDSGAVVINSQTHEVIGIVAAYSNDFSYILPIGRIMSRFSVALKQSL